MLWLRRRTSCSASVPVTGGSVSAELLHQQLDLVTGIAALLAVDMRACTVRPCPWTRCRTSTRSGIPRGGHCPEASGTCHTSRHLGRTASRGVLSPRHVPPSRSRRTASRRGRSPAQLGQRAGGLRCSRLHSGVCSHTPHLLPARSLLPYKQQFTLISYLASASPSPHICWAVRASQASREKLVSDMADAVSTGCARRGRRR